MSRGIRHAHDRAAMLAGLQIVFAHPYLLDQCQRKTNADTLRGLLKWMRYSRRCKVCNRKIPPQREKVCSSRCAKRWSSWRRLNNARKAGDTPWIDFAGVVARPLRIADVAQRLGISVEEAQRRAEADAARGKLVAWRGSRNTGPIREVGTPRKKEVAA